MASPIPHRTQRPHPRAPAALALLVGLVAFASGCTNTYDTQPAVAYYVAPPPAPAAAAAPTEGSLAASAPGQ